MDLQKIVVGDEEYSLESNVLSYEAEGSVREDAKKVGIGAGIGALIGAIAGGKKGAAVGTAVGAGAGTGAVLATSGDEVEFEVEQLFTFALERDVEMKIVRTK
jgi:outer membrane lipoprotein SlyB